MFQGLFKTLSENVQNYFRKVSVQFQAFFSRFSDNQTAVIALNSLLNAVFQRRF